MYYKLPFRVRHLLATLKMVKQLVAARTFGNYRHSIWSSDTGGFSVYEYRGKSWCIPTEPLDVE